MTFGAVFHDLDQRAARIHVLQVAAGCFAISFVILWALASAPSWLIIPGLIIAITVFTAAEMLEGPLINALVVDMAPTHTPGRYLAAYQVSWSLAAVVAPGLLTWLLTINTGLPWIALFGFCALAIGAIHVIPTRHIQTSTSILFTEQSRGPKAGPRACSPRR